MKNKKFAIAIVLLAVAFLLLTGGLGQDISRLLGLKIKSGSEYIMFSTVIIMLAIYLYEGIRLLRKPGKAMSEEELARKNRMLKQGWQVFQVIMFGLIILYFLKDKEKLDTAGESLTYAITVMNVSFIGLKLHYYFKQIEK